MSKRDRAEAPGSRENLTGLQRTLLVFVALLFGGLGVGAIFWTANEAGSAVALLLCGILTLVAVQGTKVQRISAGDNSVDFVDRIRANVARQAEETAQEDPEAAEALIESYQTADPLAQSDPVFVSARASIYESQALTAVMVAMRDLAPEASVSPSSGNIAYNVEGKLIVIEIKYRAEHRKLYLNDVRQIKHWMEAAKATSVLVISNVTPTSQAARFVEDSGNAIPIVLWQPDFGPERIESALAQLIRRPKA